MDTRRTERATDRRGRRLVAAVLTGVALAAMTILARVTGAPPGSGAANVAGQVEPTSTPIRLIRITPTPRPSTDPTPTQPAARPTAETIVIVIDDEGATDDDAVAGEIAIEFEADDWEGGYYQGNGVWYGRAWTAVYGAQSEYPSASLTFELDAAPNEDLAFTVTGLDDELAGKNPIAIEVNGQRVYEGDSPFESWDGNTANRGRDARWTTVEVILPADLFAEGENTITFLNLSASANFGLPPYNLLSTAGLTTAEERGPAADVSTGGNGDGDDDDDDDDDGGGGDNDD